MFHGTYVDYIGEDKMISLETKEILHKNMKVPLLEIAKARMYALNLLSSIEECEVALRRVDLVIDMDDGDEEGIKYLTKKWTQFYRNAVDVGDRFISCVSMLSHVKIPEKLEEYGLNLKEAYSIGHTTLMEY